MDGLDMLSSPMNPAFLFIDLLEDFFADPPLAGRRGEIAGAVNALAGLARASSRPVVWVRQEFRPDLSDAFLSMRTSGIRKTIRGTPGSALLHGIRRRPGDHEIVKKRYSAFFGTGLARLLRKHRATHVVLGGVNTHACVRTTAVDAYQRDFPVILAVDTIASYDEEYHRESLRYLEQSIGTLMTNEQIREMLDAA